MGVTIGSARIDERGRSSGGAAGDQKGGAEVSTQAFYVHSKGWVILRAKSSKQAARIAEAMIQACNNPNLGYDQAERLGVIKHGTKSTVPTECDCSSLVRQCVIEATGKDPGNFNTSTEVSALLYTKLFDRVPYRAPDELRVGDILVTKTKGHTAIVTSIDLNYPTLRKGSKGGYVKELQTILNYEYGAHLQIDGCFGPLTEMALISFQKLRGLRADGICGPVSWAELKGENYG